MSVETGTWVSDLIATAPAGTEKKFEGDNHLRLIKSVLKGTFPTAGKAFYFPDVVSSSINKTLVAADENKTVLMDTTSGALTLTLPSLDAGRAGWTCTLLKVGGTYPVMVTPPSGTINGYAKVRRAVLYDPIPIIWTGATWIAKRSFLVPLTGMIPLLTELPADNSLLPPSPNTLDAAFYPEMVAALGSTSYTVDLRGRVVACLDTLLGSPADRLTAGGSNVDATVIGGTGGAQNVTILQANLPAVSFVNSGISLSSSSHEHVLNYTTGTAASGGGVTGIMRVGVGGDTDIGPDSAGVSVATQGTAASGGSGTVLLTQPATYVANWGVVPE